jgi:hypothetical protein
MEAWVPGTPGWQFGWAIRIGACILFSTKSDSSCTTDQALVVTGGGSGAQMDIELRGSPRNSRGLSNVPEGLPVRQPYSAALTTAASSLNGMRQWIGLHIPA